MLGIVLSVIGVLGVGGFIALVVLAPTAAAVVKAVVMGVLRATLRTRIGCAILAAIVAGLAAAVLMQNHENARWEKKWAAAQAEGEKAKKEFQREMAAKNAIVAGTLQDRLDRSEQELDQKEKALEDALSNRCRLGDDARRLRELTGPASAGAAAGPNPRRVPKPRKTGSGSPLR